MSRGGTGGADRFGRPAQAVAHRDGGTTGVRHHHRHKKRRDAAFALFDPRYYRIFEGAQTADAGAENRADAGVVIGKFARLGEGFVRRSERKLFDAVSTPRFFWVREIRLRVPVRQLDGLGAANARPQQSLPEGLLANAARRDDAVARDGYSITRPLHRGALLGLGDDEVESLTDGGDAFEVLLGHLDAELRLQFHHEFDEVEAVGFEIFFETGFSRDLCCIHRENADSTLAETIEQFLAHLGLLGCVESTSLRSSVLRSVVQCPMPRPPSTGITAPVM